MGGVWNDGQPKNADEHAYRWHFQDKLLLRVHKAPAALSLITVSPATNKQTEWKFGADGSVEKSTWTLQARRDSAVIWESPSGKYAGRYQVEHEKDAISITPLDPNSAFPAKSVWNRRPLEGRFPSLASDTPKEIPSALSQLEHLVGFKSIDGVMPDSQKTIGASQGGWILGGKFFLYTSTFMTEDQMAWGATDGDRCRSGDGKGHLLGVHQRRRDGHVHVLGRRSCGQRRRHRSGWLQV